MTKSRLVAALLAATTLVVPSVAAEEAPTYIVARTGGAGLELRSGPGTDQQVVGTLPEGATLEGICSATGWQAHTVRGFISRALRSQGRRVRSYRKDGERVYRLKP